MQEVEEKMHTLKIRIVTIGQIPRIFLGVQLEFASLEERNVGMKIEMGIGMLMGSGVLVSKKLTMERGVVNFLDNFNVK